MPQKLQVIPDEDDSGQLKVIPDEKPKGILDNLHDATIKWMNEHPYGRGVLQRLWSGTSDEEKAELQKKGIRPPEADNLFHIPGPEAAAKWLSKNPTITNARRAVVPYLHTGDPVSENLANLLDPTSTIGHIQRRLAVGAVANPQPVPEAPLPAGPPIRMQEYRPIRNLLHGDVEPSSELPIKEGEILPNEPPQLNAAPPEEPPAQPPQAPPQSPIPNEIEAAAQRGELAQARNQPDYKLGSVIQDYIDKHGADWANRFGNDYQQPASYGQSVPMHAMPVHGEVPEAAGLLPGTFPSPTRAPSDVNQPSEDVAPDKDQKFKEAVDVMARRDQLERAEAYSANRRAQALESLRRWKEEGNTEQPPNPEEPLAAKSELGGIKKGVDVKNAYEELTSGYSEAPVKIMAREAIQNAMDAANKLGAKGNVHIVTDPNFLEVTDNGGGMDRRELETVFSDLHSSGKTNDPNAIGGKGVGKATYQVGGEKFEMTTVKVNDRGQKVETKTGGTPEEFNTNWPVTEKVVPSATPTGTKIKVYYTPEQKKNAYQALDMVDAIMKTTRGMDINVTHDKYGLGKYGKMLESRMESGKNDKVLSESNELGNHVKISVPKGVKHGENQFINVNYLNNGMYQFSSTYYAPEKLENAPEELLVDIKPSAKERSPEYPFPTQRESVKADLQDRINKLIEETLVKPNLTGKMNLLNKLWGDKSKFEIGGTWTKHVELYDTGNKLTPDEKDYILQSPVMKAYAKEVDRIVSEILQKTGKDEWINKVEKVGVILSSEVNGLHVPKPGTGGKQSAIYINPFNQLDRGPDAAAWDNIVTMLHEAAHVPDRESMPHAAEFDPSELNDPRIGEYMQRFLTETMEQGGISVGHGVDFIKALAHMFTSFGPKETIDAVERITRIFSDVSGGLNAETQRLLHVYQESRGRSSSEKDALIATGVKQANGPTDPTGNAGNADTDAERAARESAFKSAVSKLNDALDEAMRAREDQEAGYSEERGKRITEAMKIKGDSEAAYYKQLSKLKGELPKEEIPQLRNQLDQTEIDALFGGINHHPFSAWASINAKEGLVKLLNGETPQRSELKLLRAAFGDNFSRQIDLMDEAGFFKIPTGKFPKAQKLAAEINIFKSMMASLDLSAPLRQGMPLAYRKEWWNALIPMAKSFGSEEYYKSMMDAIENDPIYQLAKMVKLSITDTDVLANREEAFLSELAEKIPGIPASERAYMGFLNKVRFDTFKSLFKDYVKANPGQDPEDNIQMAREIARFVNTSTGRGSLGPLEQYAGLLNAGFFSPRMMASRVQMLNPVYYAKMPPYVRKQALMAILSVAGASLLITELAKLGGAKISYNPLNADFMKARWGNVRLDPNAGFQQYIVYLARFLAGAEQSSTTSRTTPFGEGYEPMNRLKLTGDFLSNKESPAAGLVHVMMRGQDFEGNKRNVMNPKDDAIEVGQRLIPMVAGDLYAIAREDPSLLWMAPLIIGGMGSQVYSAKPPVPKPRAPTAFRRPPMLH